MLCFALVAIMLLSLAACGSKTEETTAKPGGDTPESALAGTYKITVWTSETAGVKELTQQQIQAFMDANPGVVIQATIEGIGEGEAATQMVTSVEDGADLYFFAQDQLARLVQAAALTELGVKATETVQTTNDASAVKAATVNGKVYCYPATSDNGYFMFYDKSVIDESHLDSLEDLIADCEAAGKMFSFQLEGSGWYNASFFFAVGCHSDWTTDDTGAYVSVDDDFNSDKGVIALKGMQKVLKSTAYNNAASTADFEAAVPSAVVISGTWDSATAKRILGDNYGVTDLPSFTIDGQTYHLGSFSGNKLVGVKPQTDAKRAAVLQALALFLTNKECQLQRFEQFGWGPSNLEAQASEAVKSDETLSALASQNKYAIPQGQIHGSWWDISKSYATAAKGAETDADITAALDSYGKAIKGLFSMSVDEKEAFTVIGKFDGHDWNFDVEMEQTPEGTWMTKDPIAFKAGDEFQTRQGKAWDVQFGAVDAETGLSTKNNFVVSADGNYYVKLVFDKDAKTGVVTLEKVNPNYGWTVIGSIGGDSWTVDLYMEPDAAGIWRSVPLELKAGDEFKVRFGKAWDTSYGNGTANFVVETAGTFVIVFDPTTTIVSLEAK